MTIDPRWGLYISIACAALMFLAGAGSTMTDMFSPDVAKKVVAFATFFGGFISSINAVLHAIPSKPGATSEFPLGPKG